MTRARIIFDIETSENITMEKIESVLHGLVDSEVKNLRISTIENIIYQSTTPTLGPYLTWSNGYGTSW